MRRLTKEELEGRKEFRKRKKVFLKEATSGESRIWVEVDFTYWPKELEHWRKKAIEEGRLFEPEVENESLESLFIWYPKGEEEKWVLDSVDLAEEGDFYKVCPVCKKKFRPQNSRQRYCSKSCATKATNENRKKNRERIILSKLETLGKEASILFLEKEKLASEKELETVTGRRLDEWSQREEVFEEKTKELKKKLARVFSSFKRIHQDEIPNCRVCFAELVPGFNWNVGDRRYHRYICTQCKFLENQERNRRKKGVVGND